MHDAGVKWLVETLPVWEAIFFRSFTILLITLAFGRTRLLARALATPMRGALLLRACLTFTAWLCYFTASRSLPLGQLTVLYFAAPIVVVALAHPLLGERVTIFRGLAVGIGFVGVLVAADPGGIAFGLPALLTLAAADLWGYGIILMRQVARRESSLLQMLFANGCFSVAAGAMCLFQWITPDLGRLGLLVALGVVGGLGQFLLFESARRAPAAVMATVEYSALLWAFLLGFIVRGDIPRPAVFVGAGLILAAGVLLVLTEQRAGRVLEQGQGPRHRRPADLGAVAGEKLP